MTKASEDVKNIMLDPAKFYDAPRIVVDDPSLKRSQKIEILTAWKSNEEALLRAAGEGMGGGERPHLQDAVSALKLLEPD